MWMDRCLRHVGIDMWVDMPVSRNEGSRHMCAQISGLTSVLMTYVDTRHVYRQVYLRVLLVCVRTWKRAYVSTRVQHSHVASTSAVVGSCVSSWQINLRSCIGPDATKLIDSNSPALCIGLA